MDFHDPRPSEAGSTANVDGSLVVDVSNWVTHALASTVFAILAQEAVDK